MTPPGTFRIAIVGAGPSGFYAADGLLRANPKPGPDLRIDIIDRLPTPFGLVRAGVAPDHQGTKAVTRQFDRLLAQPNVRFCGNVSIGRDLSWDAVRNAYDAVIVATGRTIDRPLDIPGGERALGSWRFVAWLNGHPDFRGGPDLSNVRSVAVIGNGNVALDVARVLAKNVDEMAKSDIVLEAGAAIASAPIAEIHILGRRGPEQASFTNNELAEFGRLARAVPLVDTAAFGTAPPANDPTPEKLRKSKNLEILRGFAANVAGSEAIAVHFRFNAAPLAIHAGGIETSAGPLKADLVISCIGYDGEPFPAGEGMFAVGWAKRGPSGTIPTNRADSHEVARTVVEWLSTRTPGNGADPMPACVDAAGWQRIDKHEVAAGTILGRPRVKVTGWRALLELAAGG